MQRRVLISVAVLAVLLGTVVTHGETITTVTFGNHEFPQGTTTGSAVITVTGNEPVTCFTLVLKVANRGPKITGIDFLESGFVFANHSDLTITPDLSEDRAYIDVSSAGKAGSFATGNLARVTFDFSGATGTGPWAITFSDLDWGDSNFVELPNQVYEAGSVSLQAVPEPVALIHLLVAGGLAALVVVGRKRRV
jgi:hypothetical protein